MGCDIHSFLEYKDYERWECFASPYLGRDYNAFELMAFVRGDKGLFQPRGIPEGISYTTRKDYTLWVSTKNDTEGYTTPERAAEWIRNGCSTWYDDNRITHPDWHTPSWLNVDELKQVRDALGYRKRELAAIIAAMECLADKPDDTRLVFWFDN